MLVVSMEVQLNEDQWRALARMIGIPMLELSPRNMNEYLERLIVDHLSDVGSRINPRTMSTEELKKRVLRHCTDGLTQGSVPLIGCTDAELVQLIGLSAPKVRWARYNLLQQGLLREGGIRDTSKFWVAVQEAARSENVNDASSGNGSYIEVESC